MQQGEERTESERVRSQIRFGSSLFSAAFEWALCAVCGASGAVWLSIKMLARQPRERLSDVYALYTALVAPEKSVKHTDPYSECRA